MNTDSFFCIGSTHLVCQDYAVCSPGTKHYSAAVIVSDGCSTAPDTDFGSRILVKAQEQHFKYCFSADAPHESDPWFVVQDARKVTREMGLSDRSLYATLLTTIHRDGKFTVRAYGDGVIVARRRDGAVDVVSLVYPSGAPYYAMYKHGSPLIYEDDTPNKADDQYFSDYGPVCLEVNRYVNGELLSLDMLHADSDHFNKGNFLAFSFPDNEYDLVAVMSDGIHSFQQRTEMGTNTPISFLEILKQFMSFKNYNGVFVKRRCMRVLKELADKGISHYDDFSIGVMHQP